MRKRRKRKEFMCEDCGVIFKSGASNVRRCPKCRVKHTREQSKTWYYAHKTPGERIKTKRTDERGYISYAKGKNYCKKYNDDDIKCVVCYEQNQRKECLE